MRKEGDSRLAGLLAKFHWILLLASVCIWWHDPFPMIKMHLANTGPLNNAQFHYMKRKGIGFRSSWYLKKLWPKRRGNKGPNRPRWNLPDHKRNGSTRAKRQVEPITRHIDAGTREWPTSSSWTRATSYVSAWVACHARFHLSWKWKRRKTFFFSKTGSLAGYTPQLCICKKSHIGTGSLFLSYYHITLIERRFCLLTTESSMIRLSLSLLITFKRRMLFQVLNLNLKEDWAGRPRDRRSWQTHGRESRGGLEKDFQSVFFACSY